MQSRDENYRSTMMEGLQTTGVLLEGTFRSPFTFRRKLTSQPFRTECVNSMIVIADGDIARNAVMLRSGQPYPLGYDRFSQITFANKKFLLNCVDYLADGSGLLEIRAKEFQLRLLDQARIKEEKDFWMWLNLLVPIGTILLFGIGNRMIRHYRYARRKA
jgi:ABC-2 type transport system permease protein